jgi:hypothetical protein
MNIKDAHIENDYCVTLYDVQDGIYFLTFPGNTFIGVPKKEVELHIRPEQMLFHIKSPEEKPTICINMGRKMQAAFIGLYIALEQTKREMSQELLAIYNKENKYVGDTLYEVTDYTEEERVANTKLAQVLLSSEGRTPEMEKLYDIFSEYLGGIIHA